MPSCDPSHCFVLCEDFLKNAADLGFIELITKMKISTDNPCTLVVYIEYDCGDAEIEETAFFMRRWSGATTVALGWSDTRNSERLRILT